jgi:hypothetical protein
MSEHPGDNFFRCLSELGTAIGETYQALGASLCSEERVAYDKVFDAYSALCDATQQPEHSYYHSDHRSVCNSFEPFPVSHKQVRWTP